MDARTSSGRILPCATCGRPVSEEAFRSGAAKMYDGALRCAECARAAQERKLRSSLADSDDSDGFVGRMAFSAVPPTPEKKPAEIVGTMAFPAVIPIPPNPPAEIVGTMAFPAVIPIPPKPTEFVGTMAFPAVLPVPSQGFVGTMKFDAVLRTPGSSATVCAKCSRPIVAAEVRLEQAAAIGGLVYCHRCRDSVLSDEEEAKRAAGRRFSCIQCSRAVTARELAENRIVYARGSLHCALCARDPLAVLLGREPVAAAGACRGCGAPVASGDCAACQERVRLMLEESAVAAKDLERLATSYDCQGCGAVVTEAQLGAGEARIVGRRILCATCAAKAKPRAACARCKKPLDGEATVCETCRLIEEADAADSGAALAITATTRLSLRCSTCGKVVAKDDLAQGKAGATGGKLLCGACRSKTIAGPATRRPEVICATCDRAIVSSPWMYAGRPFCAACRPVFEAILGEGAIASPRPCSSCNATASGDGGLAVQGKSFCKGCRRQADFLVQYEVRARRAPANPPIPWRSAVAPLAAIAIVVAAGLAVSSVRGGGEAAVVLPREAPRPTPELEAIARAKEVESRPAATFAQASAREEALRRLLEAARALDGARPAIEAAHARALAARDGFAPAIAADALDRARHAYLATSDVADALDQLAKFPAALASTPAGGEVARQRGAWEALARCERRARELLASKDPRRWVAMDDLMTSSDASTCDFVLTRVGRQVDAERHVLRLAEENAPRTDGPPPEQISAEEGKALEKKHDLPGAEKRYRESIDENRFSLDALLGLARTEIERERFAEARVVARRAERLAPAAAGTRVVLAWAAFTDDAPDGHERAKRLLAGLGPNDLGPLGRRLAAILARGKPAWEGARLRVYVGLPVGEDPEMVRILQRVDRDLATAAAVLGLEPGGDRVTVVDVDEPERAGFVASLELASPPSDHVLRGCGTVVGENFGRDVRRALVHSLAGRVARVPGWILVGLPETFESGTLSTRKTIKVSLDRLDPIPAAKIASDEKLQAVAFRVCAVALAKPDGDKALARYVAKLPTDAAHARAELETFLLAR